ncbi:MAG TPA: S41 family peptidase [Bacteroidota bacterium]
MPTRLAGCLFIAFFSNLSVAVPTILGQSLSSLDRENGRMMARLVHKDIEENFFDTTFNNLELKKRFQEVDERLQTAESWGEIFRIIAQATLDLNDSHTIFLPPSRATKVDHGWEWQAVGDSVYVVFVEEGSDAASKGLKPGDRLITVNGIPAERNSLFTLSYLFYTLEPQPGFRLTIENAIGETHEFVVMGEAKRGPRVMDLTGKLSTFGIHDVIVEAENRRVSKKNDFHPLNEQTLYCKMKQFQSDEDDVEKIVDEASDYKNFILDLRGNPGGTVLALKHLVGRLFTERVLIHTARTREGRDTVFSVENTDDKYNGKLIVLVDQQSASASEAAARVIQLEKRGTIIGDRTSGSLTAANIFTHHIGIDRVSWFGTIVGIGELTMSDGHKIESVGVTPDELVLPTRLDIASGRDPVLSRAAKHFDIDLDPLDASKISEIGWSRKDR